MTVYTPIKPVAGSTPVVPPVTLTGPTTTSTPLTVSAVPGATAPMLNVSGTTGTQPQFQVNPNGNTYVQNILVTSEIQAWANGSQMFDVNPNGNIYCAAPIIINGPGYLAIQPASGSSAFVYLNSVSAPAGIKFNTDTFDKWQIYQLSGDGNLYFRDMSNSRMHMFLSPTAILTVVQVGQPGFGQDVLLQVFGNADANVRIQRGATGAEYINILAAGGGASGSNNTYYFDRIAPSAPADRALIFRSSVDGGGTFPRISLTLLGAGGPGSVLLCAGAPALNATDGFPYMPATPGIPTGVPTAQAGFVPFRYDSTTHKLWIYDAGWKGVVVS